MPFLYVLLSLLVLLATKKLMVTGFNRFIHRLGGSQHSAIITWSIIFLPGTIIHEVSHFLLAAFTGARTGKVEILPEYLEVSNNKTNVTLGSVQTQKLNPIQGFLVGFAPFISGVILLVWLAALIQTTLSAGNYIPLILESYLFFTIANSFFPSWPDIRQTLPFVIIFLIIGALAWYFGIQVHLSPASFIWPVLDSLWKAVTLSAALNLLIFGILFILHHLSKRK